MWYSLGHRKPCLRLWIYFQTIFNKLMIILQKYHRWRNKEGSNQCLFSLLFLICFLTPSNNIRMWRDWLWFRMKNWCQEKWSWARNGELSRSADRTPGQFVMCFRTEEANRSPQFSLILGQLSLRMKIMNDFALFPMHRVTYKKFLRNSETSATPQIQ